MRKICRRVMTAIMSIGILSGLCSCRLVESYKKFDIENITDSSVEDYFTSSNLDFARIKDVVIDAEIKEIDWDEYVIYIGAYSQIKTEPITVKSVTLKSDDKTFFEEESNQDIVLEVSQDGVYGGYITGGVFIDDEKSISHGKKLTLQVQVQAGDGTESLTKVINFDVKVIVYKSWVLPT